MNQSRFSKTREKQRRFFAFFAFLLGAAILWGFVLPQIAAMPQLQKKLQHLEQRGIDPNALFYSDHPLAFKNAQTDRYKP